MDTKQEFKKIHLTDALGEITWCEDRINDSDVAYVPESKLKEAELIIDKANKASTLFIGSEYHNDPAYLIKCAEKSIHAHVESIKTQVKRTKEAEAEIKKCHEVVEDFIKSESETEDKLTHRAEIIRVYQKKYSEAEAQNKRLMKLLNKYLNLGKTNDISLNKEVFDELNNSAGKPTGG